MREVIYSAFKLNLKIQPDATNITSWKKLRRLNPAFLFNANSAISEFLFIPNQLKIMEIIYL